MDEAQRPLFLPLIDEYLRGVQATLTEWTARALDQVHCRPPSSKNLLFGVLEPCGIVKWVVDPPGWVSKGTWGSRNPGCVICSSFKEGQAPTRLELNRTGKQESQL